MIYEKWRARLANANDPRMIPVEWIDARLADGEAQFWATEQAAIVTEVLTYPGGAKVIRAIAAAGKKADLAGPIKSAIEAWAKEQGCDLSMIEGREGWARMFPEYRHYQTIIVKEL